MTRYATAFKGLRIVKLDHRNKWKKNRGIQDALKTIRNGKLCDFLNTYASSVLKSADLVLLAYNSRGEVRGVAGVDVADELNVTIICNDMGKENRRGGYAPGKGLLDLLKKIAVKRRKNLTLSSVSTAINYYKRFGFKQNPKSSSKKNLIWEWRPSYSRARRFEYESVNSNSNNSNSNNRRSVSSNSNRSSATTVKISPTPTRSNRSSATVNKLKRFKADRNRDYKLLKKMSKNSQESMRKRLNTYWAKRKQALLKES